MTLGNLTSTSGSPWENPAAWDTIKIGGVYYGWGSPMTQEAPQFDASDPRSLARLGKVGALDTTPPGFVGGKVRLKRVMRAYRLDVKQPKGQNGWTSTYRGLKGERFEIIFYIWTDAQYDYFTRSILPALTLYGSQLTDQQVAMNDNAVVVTSAATTATPKNFVQALSVYHPMLAWLSIAAVEVENIGGIEPEGDGPGMFSCTVHVREHLPPPQQNSTVTPKGNKDVNQPTTPGLVAKPAVASDKAMVDNIQSEIEKEKAKNAAVPF